ncbi:hypothetical protein AEO54_365 [Vibrio phage vB_VorS-PVo5]|nr:hypothetical protein AEO54_365 [Vibrio phage vB_VorS-PVo5]
MRPLHHVEVELKECKAKINYTMRIVERGLEKRPINKTELKAFRMAKEELPKLVDWHEKLTDEWLEIKS